MALGTPLRHFLEHATAIHGLAFEEWFPESFDWRRLCADAPDMAARVADSPDAVPEADSLQAAAEATFRAAHLAGLAALAAATEGGEDPHEVLDRVARALDEDEEEVFRGLVVEELAAVEAAAAEEAEVEVLSEDGEDALSLVRRAWPVVQEYLREGLDLASAGSPVAAGVLAGIARVATILAVLRWIAAERTVEGWPEVPRDGGGISR